MEKFLQDFVTQNIKKVREWFHVQYEHKVPQFYGSCDVRNSGYKIAQVDMNLFPAGFNNLNKVSLECASAEAFNHIIKYYKRISNILILTENFTRNEKYFKNISALNGLLSSNFNVKVLKLDELDSRYVQEGCIKLEDNFRPDLIILNNDLTTKPNSFLFQLKTPITPNLGFGWFSRQKHIHNKKYEQVVERFVKDFPVLDPWLITTFYDFCPNIDFKNKQGLNEVAIHVDLIIAKIKEKYNEYDIKETPIIFIKSNKGTFGIGITAVHSGDELLEINKKTRHKMHVIKEGVFNSEVLIQEGIPTKDLEAGFPSEDVIYMINGKAIGRFKRGNTTKINNLNSPNAFFTFKNFYYDMQAMVSELACLASLEEEKEYEQ